MARNKSRLYVALYLRGGAAKMPGKEDKYHWALIVGPKNETTDASGTKHHAKNPPGPSNIWIFEEKPISLAATDMILVRVLIGKVGNPQALSALIRQVPVVDNDPEWNCVAWVQAALLAIAQNRSLMGTSQLDWETVKVAAIKYCQQKEAQGRFKSGHGFDTLKVSTFDLLQGKEATV